MEPDSLNPVSSATAVKPICSTRKRMSQFLNASGSCAPCVGSPSATTRADPTTDLSGTRSAATPSASTVRTGIALAAAHFANVSDGCCARANLGSTPTRDTIAAASTYAETNRGHVVSGAGFGRVNRGSRPVVTKRHEPNGDLNGMLKYCTHLKPLMFYRRSLL